MKPHDHGRDTSSVVPRRVTWDPSGVTKEAPPRHGQSYLPRSSNVTMHNSRAGSAVSAMTARAVSKTAGDGRSTRPRGAVGGVFTSAIELAVPVTKIGRAHV